MKKKIEQNLTEGSVPKQLFFFCLPFLMSNFLQALYNVSDVLVVSWFAGPATISGVTNGGTITVLVTNFAIGFTVGGTVLIGQYFGAGKHKELSKTIGTMFTMLAFLSVILSIIIIVFSGPILRFINVPDEAFLEAQKYLCICMGGTIFIFGYNAVASILRGMGDSKSPLKFVLISGVVNTLLDLPFVGLFKWGAAGDAASTVIAQAISLILSIFYLRKKGFVFEFRRNNFRIAYDKLRQIIKIGLPSSLQNLVIRISFTTLIAIINGFGPAASSASGIVQQINGIAVLPTIAMSSSVSSMAAQNLGAGKIERARKTMHYGILMALPIGILFSFFSYFFPEQILGFFTNDPELIAKGTEYMRYFFIDYIVVTFVFCLNGLLLGSGLTTFAMLNSVFTSIILRIPLAFLFSSILGLSGVGLASPVTALGGGISSFIFYKTGYWKKKKLI